jgi:hypothetical protein
LKVEISARRSSSTMDFSCVTTQSGLVHWTAARLLQLAKDGVVRVIS